MEDIFYFQKIYLINNNFDILDYKKILEKRNINIDLNKLKYYFLEEIKNNINNPNYINSINLFYEKYKINYIEDIYQYISKFEFIKLNHDLIDYDLIRKIYKIENKNEILKKIYDKSIKIKNNEDFNKLINFLKLDSNKIIDIYDYYYKNSNVNDFIVNMIKLNNDIKLLKNNILYIFYKKIFRNKFLEDDDLLYFLIINDYELNINKFIDLYDDIDLNISNFKTKYHFYIYYLKNYNIVNKIYSLKFLNKLYPKFDLDLFIYLYNDLLLKNNINIKSKIEIINFYHKNNDLIYNYEDFNDKYNIDVDFIKNIYNINNIKDIIKFVINNNPYLNEYEFKKNEKFNINLILKYNKNIKNNIDIIKYVINGENNYKLDSDYKIDYNFVRNYYNYHNLNDNEIDIINYEDNNLINNIDKFINKNDLNFNLLKIINYKLNNINDSLIIDKIILNEEKYLLNYKDFIKYYLNLLENKKYYINDSNNYFEEYFNIVKNIDNNNKLLKFIEKDVYDIKLNKNYIGRKNVFIIEEVLLDLEQKKPKLNEGVSLIIRARNEEKNIKICIESVVDLVEEIIFVNNNSDDNTLKIINELALKYKNIKVYNYFIDVKKVGIEHQKAIKDNDKNTLGNFYNWCLSKSTMNNVVKWDADFICIRNNFKSMIENYKIKNKNNKYALWFSGYTLFHNLNKYYINLNSYYNEYRLFSYKNNFKWYDGDLCEFNDPYIEKCNEKIKVNYPIFYEIKRTEIDEFKSRSSLIDKRDIDDYNILKNLKDNKNNKDLYYINDKLLNKKLNIILITHHLNMGGSNIFILGLYNYFKLIGFNIKIYCESINNKIKRFENINNFDIYELNDKLLETINNNDYIIFNGYIPNKLINILNEFNIIKKIFITHSDVAWSNYYVKKYYEYFYKIITVNNYTKEKIKYFLKLKNDNKIKKIINYLDIKNNEEINLKKNKKFGIISRFSEDKNIIMLLFSLKNFFKIHSDYEFYLVGYENDSMQRYIKYIINYLDLNKYIKIEGFRDEIENYYKLFDFIILPSVSEGTSYNLIESMIYQKLIIASNVGGNNELLENNCIIIDYDNIKEYEKNNLYIENYNDHLNLLGYYTIKNLSKLKDNYSINVDYSFEKIDNIPSIFIEYDGNDNILEEDLFNLKTSWDKNCYKIFNSLLHAVNINNETKQKYITNNKNKINNEYNKLKYYEDILNILDISI